MKFLALPSLRWRLVAVMCVAYIIVAILSGAAGYTTQRQSLRTQLDVRARTDAAILAAGAASPLSVGSHGSIETLQQFVNSVKAAQGVSYADIRNSDGCISASTRRVVPGPKTCQDFTSVEKSKSLELSDGSVMGIAPIAPASASTVLGYSVVILSNASVQSDLRNILVLESAVRLFGLAIFILLSLVIARYILGPLTDLSRAALAIRSGRLGTRMAVTGNTELATVAAAFNGMATSLEQRIRHLTLLARSGAELPTTLRERKDVQPLLEEFARSLGSQAAGLVSSGEQILWCAESQEACRRAVESVAGRATVSGLEDHGGFVVMAVPVPGDAVFVTARSTDQPFTDEEQKVITNFAHQMGIAADNVRLFDAQQEALQVKDQFLSIVSHELRTPLTTMKGYAQMLRRKLVDDPDGLRFASSIDAQVSRLSRLVDDLLDVTRFSRGQFELTRTQMDLRPVLEDTVSRFRVIVSGHAIELELDGESFEGCWDRDRLEQVLNNLIGNAIKYSPDGGTITVQARHEEGAIQVAVRDHGIGIPEGDQQRLFERFYRGTGETHDVKGLGLGLYVTQRVIAAHGGEIRVESRPGEGSEFAFTLPLVEAPIPEPASS